MSEFRFEKSRCFPVPNFSAETVLVVPDEMAYL